MNTSRINDAIRNASQSRKPVIPVIKQASSHQQSPAQPGRLGIFASSFNPVTSAHLELMRLARAEFALDEMLALAGLANADKAQYESSLEDRLTMLELALRGEAHTAIGLSSHAFFVDMLDALGENFPPRTDVHFILGFDTFERVLDPEDRYTRLYHQQFLDRTAALNHLLTHSRLLVAGRAGAKHQEVTALCEKLPAELSGRVSYLDFPDDLAEQSATQVRSYIRQGLSISGLVPESVEQYINERGLYGFE